MRWSLAGILFMFVVLAIDGYSYGWVGGDVQGLVHPWQITLALACAVLLGVAFLLFVAQSETPVLRAVLVAEACVYLVANCVYVVRDGVSRFAVGYDLTLGLAWLVGLAMIVRALVIVRSWRARARVSRPDPTKRVETAVR